MIIDGKKIAEDIKIELREKIASLGIKPKLGIFTIDPDPAITQFVGLKKRFGEAIGVEVIVIKMEDGVAQEDAENTLKDMVEKYDGVVVQLPLPEHIDAQKLLNLVPKEKDVDVLSDVSTDDLETPQGQSLRKVFSPVAGAVREIFEVYGIPYVDQKIAIVGAGQLVGMPVYYWLVSEGVVPALFDIESKADFLERSREFDILISGVGIPGMITKDMVRDGAVLIDAGTAESAGKIVGDIDPACGEVASYFSTVPGGVGPITVAILFRNLVELSLNPPDKGDTGGL